MGDKWRVKWITVVEIRFSVINIRLVKTLSSLKVDSWVVSSSIVLLMAFILGGRSVVSSMMIIGVARFMVKHMTFLAEEHANRIDLGSLVNELRQGAIMVGLLLHGVVGQHIC